MAVSQRSAEATVWVGNLDPMITEELLYELFINTGPVSKVSIPKDKVTGAKHNFAFVEFEQPTDADYACKIMSNIKVYQKPLKLSRSAHQKATLDQSYHAKLFIGNLDQSVDEHQLYELFVQFGAVLSAKLMTEPDSDESRGFGFVQFDSFESADAAIAAMDGQYIANRPIHVNYAFKPNSKGERHGTEEERELERQAKASMGATTIRPNIQPINQSVNQSILVPPPPPMPPVVVNEPIRLSLNSSQQQIPYLSIPAPPASYSQPINQLINQIPPPPAFPPSHAAYPTMPPGFTPNQSINPPGFAPNQSINQPINPAMPPGFIPNPPMPPGFLPMTAPPGFLPPPGYR